MIFSIKRDRAEVPSNQEIFFAHYPRLLDWASQLTRFDSTDPEDLVHDVYIQIANMELALSDIESIEPYLLKVVQNLHFSRLRRAGRIPIDSLSIVDYDSIERGMAAVGRGELLILRDELRQICEYVCERKNTARSASVLILRFFFGYSPSEVMKITLSSRPSVDQALKASRSEVRLALLRPGALSSLYTLRQSSGRRHTMSPDHPSDLFAELWGAIWNSCAGECIGLAGLKQRYIEMSPQKLTAQELAHTVSCPKCLDEANSILGLPLLAERSADGSIGRNKSSGSGGSAGTGTPLKLQSRKARKTGFDNRQGKLDKKLREVFEHRPASLEIVVDGELRTSQKITSETNELHLKLGHNEKPEYIEIYSEQGVLISYLPLQEPAVAPKLQQHRGMVLSDGRSLDLTLSSESDFPTIRVLYRDPVFSQEAGALIDPLDIVDMDRESDLRAPVRRSVPEDFRTADSFWKAPIRSIFRHAKALTEMNLTLAFAISLSLASVALFTLWLYQRPHIAPGDLLQQAQTRDDARLNARAGVVYQKVRIRSSQGIAERMLYRDTRGIRRPKHVSSTKAEVELAAKLTVALVNWDDPLSAANYKDWHDHSQIVRDTIERTGQDLTLTTIISGGNVDSESLTVRESDFHTIARTLQFRDIGTVEIAEVNYDILPWSAASEGWFEPDTLSGANHHRDLTSTPIYSRPSRHLTDEEMDAAELSAEIMLDRLQANKDGRLEVVRFANGVQVKGIVESRERKDELTAQLNQLPHVVPSIFTFQELQARQAPIPQVGPVAVTSDDSLPDPLRQYVLSRGLDGDRASRISDRLLESAVAINQGSLAISKLLRQFGGDRQLSKTVQDNFDQFLAKRRTDILAALDEESKAIDEIGLAPEPITQVHSEQVHSEQVDAGVHELRPLAERNRALCEELISPGVGAPRKVDDILSDLGSSVHSLRAAVLQLPARPSSAAVSNDQR